MHHWRLAGNATFFHNGFIWSWLALIFLLFKSVVGIKHAWRRPPLLANLRIQTYNYRCPLLKFHSWSNLVSIGLPLSSNILILFFTFTISTLASVCFVAAALQGWYMQGPAEFMMHHHHQHQFDNKVEGLQQSIRVHLDRFHSFSYLRESHS